MNTNRLLISVMGLALMATPAFAKAVPIISGKYAGSYSQTCQAIQATNDPGSTDQAVTLTTFDPVSGTAQLNGVETIGSLVVWTGGNAGMQDSGTHKSLVYSNNATTMTVDGVVYHIAYGPVKNGIAQSFIVSGQPFPNCAVSIVLIHQ